ncbi:mechanosensitive ion channel [Clostridium polynesiense]|uniref:mechanosensitive ion channel n=1 Tax=Clostridium polynesiense TaxID=1325933 RepID=UPI000694BB03|nr:mechanosensitive ion channel [Clostridium polynesiense]
MEEIRTITYPMYNAIPNILSAVLLLLLAIIVASIVKSLIIKGGRKMGLPGYIDKWGLSNNKSSDKTLESLGKAAFWLIFILFFPSILEALNMRAVSTPITNMTSKFLNFLPNILGAVLVLIVGYIIAKVVRDLLALLLRKLKVDELQDKAGLTPTATTSSFSTILANVVYVLIWIPIIISALEILNIKAISQPAIGMLNNILNMIPNIFVAAILIAVGVYVSKLVGNLVSNLLAGVGINSIYKQIGFGKEGMAPRYLLSDVIGKLVKFIIILLFAVEALNVVNLEVLNRVGFAIIAYLPFFLSAVIILGAGLFIGKWVEGLLGKYTSSSRLTAALVKYSIIVFAVFMTLSQLGIAMVIVNTAFIIILGALAIAFAISFGIGGRKFAERSLEKFERKMETSAPASGKDVNTEEIDPTDNTPPVL